MRWWIGLVLLAPLALAAQTEADACAISGQVSSAATGAPLRRALVYLRRMEASPGVTNSAVSQTAMTDAAGRFAMAGIAPGKYRLSAERSGYLAGQYGSSGPGKSGVMLTLEPGQKANDLTIKMTPHGVIAGRVLDDEGEPMASANVQVSRQQYLQGRKQLARVNAGLTNDLGEYRIFGLAPGRYYVGVESRPNPSLPAGEDEYVTTYFPRTTDITAAGAVDVAPGAQLRNIDIAMAKVHTVLVRGRVINELAAAAAANNQRLIPSVMLSQRIAGMVGGGITRGAAVTPQGTFELPSVTPGQYWLITQLNSGGRNYTARATIQVGGANVEGVTLTLRGGTPVSGQVRVEGESTEGLSRLRISMMPAEFGGVMYLPMATQMVKEDGSFRLEDVGSDRYMVAVSGLPEGFYLKSIRSANLDVLAAGLEISGDSPAPLEVILSSRGGQVTGTVMDPRTQKSAAQATVVLAPQEKERRDRESYYRTVSTDASGGFTFKGLTPGEYRVYAWEETEYGAWMDPDFLKPQESRGEAVSIAEGARESVQVKLIPAEAQ